MFINTEIVTCIVLARQVERESVYMLVVVLFDTKYMTM